MAEQTNWFSVRVELQPAADYDALHKAMWNAGFRRFWVSNGGKKYKLPTGSYVIASSSSPAQIRDEVIKIAKSLTLVPILWIVQFVAADFWLYEIAEDPDAPKPKK